MVKAFSRSFYDICTLYKQLDKSLYWGNYRYSILLIRKNDAHLTA